MHDSLGKPFVQRCREIEDIVKTSSHKDLSGLLPGLLDNIFGSGTDPGWGLDVITRGQQPHEFEAMVHFLGPEGPLMNLIYQLRTDVYLAFDFPFQNLPAPTRHMIEAGSIPMFYVNKLQYQGYGKPSLSLNAFELYMFHFAHSLASTQWQAKSFNWKNMHEVVYPRLLEEYLLHFLPLNKKSLPKFPQAPQMSMKSPMMQMQSPVTSNRRSPNSGVQTRSRPVLGLLKPNVLSPQKQHGRSSPVDERAEGEIWWSETFIQVIAEFWLNQNALDTERGITPQNLESFLPSNNHVRLARVLLKHVHHFVNSAEPEVVMSQYQSVNTSPLEDFKRNLIPSLLQKKLYSFLRHSFERWPLDTSFRLVLEMWLSYIQPWRYLETGRSRGAEHKEAEVEAVNDAWFPFIRDNLLFYTVLFQEFLERSRRTQLTSVYHAYMLFRVSKVFSLPNLAQLLREAEKMMYPSAYRHAQELNNGSYIAPDMSPVLRIQIAELERPDFVYVNMFGDMDREIAGLLQQIMAAMSTLHSCLDTGHTAPKTMWGYFTSMFEDHTQVFGDLTVSEVKKLEAHLEQAKGNICKLFSIRSSDIIMPPSPGRAPPHSPGGTMSHSINSDQSSLMMNQSMMSNISEATPECEMTNEGYQLTDRGRYQLMNGLRKFSDIHYQCDPDLQPIKSHENATLVRMLYRLSSFINTHFSSEIQSLHQRQDFLGKMSHVYFASALPSNKLPSSPLSKAQLQRLQSPRLRLRFLASYQTLMYIVLLHLFLWFGWGVGPVGYILILCLGVCLYGLFRALLVH